jgi:hypothetical protein
LDEHSSMINYLFWKLELEKNNIWNAIVYFKTSISLDEKWEFWIRSKNILETINNQEKWI